VIFPGVKAVGVEQRDECHHVVAAALTMIIGVLLVFARLKAKQVGFGPNSLKSLGLVLFIPTLLMISVATNFQTETLAALLGTVAGYVLSLRMSATARRFVASMVRSASFPIIV
jgi:hypothetical protein